jgi:proline racemase
MDTAPGAVSATDYHTAGEPFRIVTAGQPEIPGSTVLERREFAQASADIERVRRLLVNEPRGHADMYGGFLVPPDDDGAHFGVLFWHKDGYSTACGHGTIALGAWAVNSGRVPAAGTATPTWSSTCRPGGSRHG